MEWDDIRIFLALVRAGSVRAAAAKAGVSHSTVARRVEAFETRLGVKLFDRLPSGYVLTGAGEDLLEVAENVENELDGVQRRLVGQDRRLAGVIRVTMVDVIATHLLMPNLTEFRELYPDIELQVVITYEPLDLTRREADVAIRFVKTPPDHLIGHRLATVANAAYATQDYLDNHDLADPTSVSWIGFGLPSPFPKWVKESDYPHVPAKGVFDSMLLQLQAARCGMGIANLPCFIGDPDPDLSRLPPGEPRSGYDLWLLRHRDTRSTARLRVFSEFIAEAVSSYRPLLEGGM
ncbi:MAG: LysR family transcriptional regulator [Pseudomonadales bacterium]